MHRKEAQKKSLALILGWVDSLARTEKKTYMEMRGSCEAPRAYKFSPKKSAKTRKKSWWNWKTCWIVAAYVNSVVIPGASNINPTRAKDSLVWSKLVKERKKDDGPGKDFIQVVSMAKKKKNKRK